MTRYIVRRAIQSFFLLWVTTLIGFTVYQAAPGGPIQFLDDDPTSTAADSNRLVRLYGLDRSVPVQYVAWLAGEDWLPEDPDWRSGRCLSDPERCGRGIVRLDFGRSFFFKGRPAIEVIAERIPATFLLGYQRPDRCAAGYLRRAQSWQVARPHRSGFHCYGQHGASLVVGVATAHFPGRLPGPGALERYAIRG